MSNKDLLSKLLKIAENQQKAIVSIAQLTNSNAEYIDKFIRTSVSLFLVNNSIFAKERSTLEQINPNTFKVLIKLEPATKTPLSESVVDDLKSFLTTKIQANPALKSKSIDLDVQTLPL